MFEDRKHNLRELKMQYHFARIRASQASDPFSYREAMNDVNELEHLLSSQYHLRPQDVMDELKDNL